MQPEVTGFFDEATNTISYVAVDPATRKCAVIDSVLDYDPSAGHTDKRSADRIIEFVRSNGLAVEWVLETHVHADHLSAAPYIKQQLGGKLAIGAEITTVQNVFGKIFNAGTEFQRDGSQFDVLFEDGDSFRLGEIPARVMHTPGHTPADLTYVIGEMIGELNAGHAYVGGGDMPRPGRVQTGLLGAELSLFVTWNLSTLGGAFLGGAIPDPTKLGLDLVFPLAFLALLVPLVRTRTELLVALFSAALAYVVAQISSGGVPIVVTGVAGSLLGAWLTRGRQVGEPRLEDAIREVA